MLMKRIPIFILCLLFMTGCAPRPEYLLAKAVYDDGDGSPGRNTYEYDEAGRLLVQTFEDEDFYGMGPIYERIEFAYDDHDQLLRESIYNESGLLRVRAYVNSYDDGGRLLTSDSYEEGEPYESWTHSYDEQGNLACTAHIRRSSHSTDTIVETFDEQGNVLLYEITTELNGTASTAVVEYFYEDGRLIRTEDDEGGREVYTYDRDGRITRYERYTGETLSSFWEYRYTADTETQIHCEPDGTVILTQVRSFDSAENLIKEESYNSDGTIFQSTTYSYITK